jgi:hypothetical protein
MADTYVKNTQILGLPKQFDGYNPNAYANCSEVVINRDPQVTGILTLADGVSVRPGFVVAKKNSAINDAAYGLPSAEDVAVGNLWLIDEGLYPDNTNVTVRGLDNGESPQYFNGHVVSVIPLMQKGSVIQAWVAMEAGKAQSIKSGVYVTSHGYLNSASDGTDVISTTSIGYILVSPMDGQDPTSTTINQVYVTLA